MKLHGIEIDDARLGDFCRRHNIRELLFFGSVTREDFRPDSDLDVIVNFLPGLKPSLLVFGGIQMDLTALLGRQVHLHTDQMIPPALREQIRRDARVAYAA